MHFIVITLLVCIGMLMLCQIIKIIYINNKIYKIYIDRVCYTISLAMSVILLVYYLMFR